MLMLITLFCMHKTTGDVRDPYRLANSGPKAAVAHAKATNEG